jgi:hypothetical protein
MIFPWPPDPWDRRPAVGQPDPRPARRMIQAEAAKFVKTFSKVDGKSLGVPPGVII